MDKILEERENNGEQNETPIMMIVQVEIVVVIIMIAMDKMIITVVKAMTVVEITTRRQIDPFQLFLTKISIFFIFYFF